MRDHLLYHFRRFRQLPFIDQWGAYAAFGCAWWVAVTAALPGLAQGVPAAAAIEQEIQELITNRAPSSAWAEWGERLYRQRQLAELSQPGLPWATWWHPGWRFEVSLPQGGKVLLATDGIVWVAIRHDRVLDITVRQLVRPTAQQSEIRGAWGKLKASSQPQQKLAASAADLARKAPDLFPIYFYFAGPPAEIVGSQHLPPPEFPLYGM